MRITKKSFKSFERHYEFVTNLERDDNLKDNIEKGLSSIFLISQNIPKKNVSDFFSNEDFSLSECFEELEISYELIKLGFYKQSIISLRTALDIGLLSIYWSLIGIKNKIFIDWLNSKINTPFRNNAFWKIIFRNKRIEFFSNKYGLINKIKEMDLSDYVHTKGYKYSNYSSTNKELFGDIERKEFLNWFSNFKNIIEILEILHLLRYPTLNLRYDYEFLLRKFGTRNKIPIFGAGYGDEMIDVPHFIEKTEYSYILELIKDDNEYNGVKKWITDLPDLEEEEIKEYIYEEQKREILTCGGFNKWYKNYLIFDHRIDDSLLYKLKFWAIENDIMEFDHNKILKASKKLYNVE